MLLNIHDEMTIGDLQDKFNECFQHLKIEFYRGRHKWQKGSSDINKIDPTRKIGEIRTNHNNGVFEIKSWFKTGRVEQELRHLFGLHAQIFFLKNNEWIETVSADDLTLAYLDHSDPIGLKEEEKE